MFILECTDFEPEKGKDYSQGRDYSIRYGKNSQASKNIDEGKSWSDKQLRTSGLTDKKPL